MDISTKTKLEAIDNIDRWALVFAGYATITEVFGLPEGGLVDFEVAEAHLAYGEWRGIQEAEDKFKAEHDARDGKTFPRIEFLDDRREAIERGEED